MKVSGSSPYNNVFRSRETSKTKKTKKSKYAEKSQATGEVATPDAVAPVDLLDSPYYDAMAAASKCLEETESIEEATQVVVSTVINEQLGNKGLPSKELKQIAEVVTRSIANDDQMRKRLESVLRRISAKLAEKPTGSK